MRGGAVADPQVLADGVDGEQRPDLAWEHVPQQLHPAEIPDHFHVTDILAEEPFIAIAVPPAQGPFVLGQQRFREASESF